MRYFGLVAVLVAWAIPARTVAAQAGSPPAGQALFTLDFGQLVGDFPKGLKPLTGSLEVVTKDGVPMLRASSVSEFLITLPQVLPPAFTVEFVLIPKQCCNPEDLGFEGTATMNRGTASAQVLWSRERLAVIGGGEMYQGAMPAALAGTLPGQLSTVVVTFDSTEVKLYTNGQRLFTLADRRFMRGRVLRVFLGGQDEGDQAVYLAGLRITAGATAPMVLASQQSGSRGSLTSAGSTIRPAGTGTIATPTAAPPASTAVVSRGPVLTPQSSGRTSGALSGASAPPAPADAPMPARTITIQGFAATGTFAGLPSRTISLSGFDAVGTFTGLAPRAIALGGFSATGTFAALSPRSVSLPGFTAAGIFTALAPRTVSLSGFTATGTFTALNPRTVSLAGFTATGTFPTLAPRTIAVAGFSAMGVFTTLAPRTVVLSGWTAVGVNP